MPRPLRSLFPFALALILGLASLALAEAPKNPIQVPGYYRLPLGQFEVVALYDGGIELDVKQLKNISADELGRLLARKFVGNPKMQTAVNAYLVNTGSRLILVDAGAGGLFGPTVGHLVRNMRAAGYEPGQVDMVVITHLHPDHFGGLCDASGQPLFPNADILVSQPDNDYWLSRQVADAAPEAAQRFFKMARDAAAPYQGAGKWKTFAWGSVLAPGVRAEDARGHTPGHTAFAIESDGQKLLIWGDLTHSSAVQFAKPDVTFEYDTDQKQAAATRRRIMKEAATGRYLVAGMHQPFPGIGHVRADGKNRYDWVPIEFTEPPQAANP